MSDDGLPVVADEFDDVVRQEYPTLVAVATALSGFPEDGEDLVQDTVVKALLRWSTVQRMERPGGLGPRRPTPAGQRARFQKRLPCGRVAGRTVRVRGS